MMTREICFRFRDIDGEEMSEEYDLYDVAHVNTPYNHVEGDTIAMQRTGLKDKNGVKIYEGDIVRSGGSYKYEIKRQEQSAGFMFYNIEPDFPGPKYERRSTFMKEAFTMYGYKVIGNIYENPSLLSKDLR